MKVASKQSINKIHSFMFDDETEVITDFETDEIQYDLGMRVGSYSTEEYAIKYIIHTTHEAKELVLLFHDTPDLDNVHTGMNYCSKVEKGQSLEEVVDKEIFSITSSNRYVFERMYADGKDFDKYGNELKRYGLVIEVPYFETKGKNYSALKNVYMTWVNQDSFK